MWCSPNTHVSDNGPRVRVGLTSAPFHPPSNGEAERLLGIFKTMVRRSEEGNEKDSADEENHTLTSEYLST